MGIDKMPDGREVLKRELEFNLENGLNYINRMKEKIKVGIPQDITVEDMKQYIEVLKDLQALQLPLEY